MHWTKAFWQSFGAFTQCMSSLFSLVPHIFQVVIASIFVKNPIAVKAYKSYLCIKSCIIFFQVVTVSISVINP